ncbi:MAG: DegT/DnrJ/EryC1/StrS family aminotransferase, partial [Pseudomonas sp.]|nr:DegT/DnrJ/EryC1/StrS family aminotransferase [Pseudomonas sp.]
KYAHATSSCTGALHLGLSALGVGEEDEVILADTNWIATCAPIMYLGATPVFADIDPTTWCISPDRVVTEITKNTKAIIATHLYGNLCWMDTLLAIGKKHNIPVIEDAAEAIGSKYKSKLAGSMGKFGVFSFHGTKTMTTGEGGMFVTNDPSIYEKVLQLNNHGRSPKEKKQFFPRMIGYKYKISNVQAAIGCAQLERIENLVCVKRFIFAEYQYLLRGVPVRMNFEQNNCFNSFWMPTIVSEKPNRDKYIKAFKKAGIDARVFFYPLSSLPMFKKVHNPVAYDICQRSVNLPSYHGMKFSDQKKVVSVIKEVEGCG